MARGVVGGSLSSLRDVVRQVHTIQRKAVIYTTLRIVGYLLLWRYSCFISGTENSKIFSLPTIHMNITMRYGRVKMVPRPTSSTAKTVKYPKKTGLKVHYSPILQRKRSMWKSWSETLEVIALVIENARIFNVNCLSSKDRRRRTSGHNF